MKALWHTPFSVLETIHFYDEKLPYERLGMAEHFLMSPKFGEVYVVTMVSNPHSTETMATVTILYANETSNSNPTIYRPMTQHTVPKGWIINSISSKNTPKSIMYRIVNHYTSDCDVSVYNRFRIEYAMAVDTTNEREQLLFETMQRFKEISVLETNKIIYINLGLIDLLRVLKSTCDVHGAIELLSDGLSNLIIEFMKDYYAYLRV